MLLEIRRKLWHFVLSSIGLLLTYFGNKYYGISSTIDLFIVLLVISIILDYLRVEFRFNLPIYSSSVREKEKNRFCGLTYGLIAIVIILSLFDFSIAFASLAMAFYGDMFAALIGKRYGKTKIYNGKTLEGSLTCLIINIILGLLLLDNLLLIISMAIFATLVELFTNHIDDNFAIPLLTTIFGTIIKILL